MHGDLKKLTLIVDKIESCEKRIKELSDRELKQKTVEFQVRLKKGESLDQILPEAYAVVREASWRVLGMRHYRVQLIGGIVLHQGRIAEMRTGEGKTLVAALPAYLNALTGKGVHVVTVNDYLAKRDAEKIGKIHRFLGLSVGVILNGMSSEERKRAYACDITYVTNNELGFDYLRDNMVRYERDLVQRGFHYCIIDEADSVLIDEAGTPLIISGMGSQTSELYVKCNTFVKKLRKGSVSKELSKLDYMMKEEAEESGDFVVDEKDKTVNLTEAGVKKAESFFQIENIASDVRYVHHINLALRANYLMRKDKEYVVKDGEILIVDPFTGRILPGRRYSDGLHQALETKEGAAIKQENQTLASITFQSLFNMYPKKGGMTGTGKTAESEFKDIYSMDVVVIPTNRPVKRTDMEDVICQTKKDKYVRVVMDIKRTHQSGQPVLIGTASIEDSEMLGRILKQVGIPHHILNAKEHEREAEIIALAGQHGAVTIATDMAGRGTDIKLDDLARNAGGLKVIGTERHTSRRVDDQLIGRSGRQGDPGESVFYLSMEDELLKLYKAETANEARKAQKNLESLNLESRKNMMEYEKPVSEQRGIFYEERRKVLEGRHMRVIILRMISDYIDESVRGTEPEVLMESVKEQYPEAKFSNMQEMVAVMKQYSFRAYEAIEKRYDDPQEIREIERVFLLQTMDTKWAEHLAAMEYLRVGSGLQALGQKDPKIEYKMTAYEMFARLTREVREETLKMLFGLQ